MKFSDIVLSYFSIGDYEILIIQDTEGELITIKVDDYGRRTEITEYVQDGEYIH